MLHYNIEEKLDTVVARLNALRYVSKEALEVYFNDELDEGDNPPQELSGFEKFSAPYTLFETNKYYWFMGEFEIKDTPAFCRTYFSVDTFITGATATTRPQGLLYINGEVCQGIDINHTDVLLPAGRYKFALKFYTHTFIRSLPVCFSLKTEDERIADVYYDFLVARDTVKLLLEKTDDYRTSITALERAANFLDFRRDYSEEFYSSIDAAREYLYNNYYVKRENAPTVHLVGHTHIDVAWLWDLCQTKQKAERSFSTVIKLMEEYPEYKFMSSQPILHLFVNERNPKLYGKIREKVKEGRWEVDGGMWLEADCNLTSGESLVRQLLYGTRFFKQEFGKDSTTLWLPDVFGYSAALPAILQGFGIDRFVTAKIGWNDTNRMPYDAFIWQGIDGSEVFVMFISTCACDPRAGIYDRTYTSYCEPICPEKVLATWHRFEPKEFCDSALMSYGWGDGGGGPTREMLENAKRLSYGLPGMPAAKLSTLDEALNTAKSKFMHNASELKRYPKWCGELYFEYHRGTLTSVPRIKYNNRKGESALQNAEVYSVIAQTLVNSPYPKKKIYDGWLTLLLNQFHDIIPGSSIEKVYIDSDEQFRELFASMRDVRNSAQTAIADNLKTNGGLLVFNPNGFTATGTVEYNGKSMIAENIPPFGYKVIVPKERESLVKVGDRTLENALYRIIFAEDGSIISFFDKRADREIVKTGEHFNEFVAFEDMPNQYHNWEMAPYHKTKSYVLDSDAIFSPIFDGARSGFEITQKYNNSEIRQKIFLYDGLERVDFVTNVDWNESHELLKIKFPFDMLINRATYDIQFGSVERATNENTSWEGAKFETVGQKWVDMTEGRGYGVALLNDCKYGFGTEESTLSMTVVKSGGYPYQGASEIIPEFVYSIYPHIGDLYESGVIKEAYMLNRPLEAVSVDKTDGGLPESYSFAECMTDGVILETLKMAEDGDALILRLFETNKERKTVRLKFGESYNNISIVNLAEQFERAICIKDGIAEFEIKPHQIITIKIS